LIGNIVDGEDAPGVGEEGILSVDGFEVGGDQSRLPFVMMDDVRGESQIPAQEESCLREEDKTLRIVKIIRLGGAIEVFSIIKLFSADEIDWDFLIKLTLIKIDADGLPSYCYFDFIPEVSDWDPRLLDHPIVRHD
jgi:hypothetical protein